MATVTLMSDEEAAGIPEVAAVFADIRAVRRSDVINDFWRGLAHDPATLKRTWEGLKAIMIAPGPLDPLTRELIYMAVSVTNGCSYCIHSHTAAARAKGMTDAQYGHFLAIVGMANQTNALVTALGIAPDKAFQVS
ncbi:carboxymuconolactone decarboxylase family protein [Enterovirga rhinocerotis]|uniref:AhpD family alkylhydroperoxidase n=1 Tax=Enterovirga rhinocerotis TaxID=1339210 RepID=A0A4R7C130_9HYPH|nr:carboxymuconolactone decarboxylase family protein [Enterovirga rhinocerotis]TDR90086.1 AhpD family alkylhydroperoxidase [Enterovirga rhinocerotis]